MTKFSYSLVPIREFRVLASDSRERQRATFRKCRRFSAHLSKRRSPALYHTNKARTRRMQATVGRPWLGRACGLEYAALIEPHLRP